jgi:hypothetical protein
LQGIVNGWQRAAQAQSGPHFPQGQVGLAPQEGAHFLSMGRQNDRFATGKAVPRSDVTRASALLEKLFDHPQGNAKTLGDLLTIAVLAVVGSQDSFT